MAKHIPGYLEKAVVESGDTQAEVQEVPAGLCECGCGEKTGIWSRNDRAKGRVKGEPLRFVRGHNSRPPEEARAEYRKRLAASRDNGRLLVVARIEIERRLRPHKIGRQDRWRPQAVLRDA